MLGAGGGIAEFGGLLFPAHPPHRRFAFQARGRLHQILKALLLQIFQSTQFHVPDVFTRAFQETLRILQRSAEVKSERYMILARHEKTKWIRPLEGRDSPGVDRFLRAGHALLH